MPVYNALNEVESLFHWATDDKPMLVVKGLEVIFLNELPIRAGAYREAKLLWLKERNTEHVHEKEWSGIYDKAEKLRKVILGAFDFAFSKDERLLKQVDYIRKGSGQTDMTQDLNNMAVLGLINL